MGLTDKTIKNATPRDKKYKLIDEKGLFVLIKPNGSKYFRLDYRFAGIRKEVSIGVYPDITLQEARKIRDDYRILLKSDIDPAEMKKAKKYNMYLESSDVFEAVAREWHTTKKPKWKISHANRKWRAIEKNIFPYLGNRPIKNITAQELLSVSLV